MLICGFKLTHDGGVAVIEDGKLIVQIDSEKLDNNGRFSSGNFDALVTALLDHEGISLGDVGAVAIDGWHPRMPDGLGEVRTMAHSLWRRLPLAPYLECEGDSAIQERRIVSRNLTYASYPHACGHVMAAYCSSPFAQTGEDSFVLVWDGGMCPRLYFWSAENGAPQPIGPILPLHGSVYADFAVFFEPFVHESRPNRWPSWPELDRVASLSCAGKVMAYSAFGCVDHDLARQFSEALAQGLRSSEEALRRLVRVGRKYGGSTADLFATFQDWLGQAVLDALRKRVRELPQASENLCLSGGCALNVIWNRRIREEGGFPNVWVPPFPNDSGSALGVACAEMVARGHDPGLTWSVYSGPRLTGARAGGRPCSERALAELLHRTAEPIVVLHDRAELGPRALGNRSIFAACTSAQMQTRMNDMKKREPYRPIAPICLEDRSKEIFAPGGRDPYMLFAHSVRSGWVSRIPAVVHVDGSARLQTVSDQDNPLVAELLRQYESLSGVPVLCNTSANESGAGFFPDAESAIRWGKTRFVWADGRLYDVRKV